LLPSVGHSRADWPSSTALMIAVHRRWSLNAGAISKVRASAGIILAGDRR
jgi:hypothetical protein